MPDIQEPSKTKKPVFSKKIANKILIELDGWQLIRNKDLEKDKGLFIDFEDPETLKNIKGNKKVSMGELKRFYDTAFNEALNDTNRYDIDDLNDLLVERFTEGVIKLAASNIWLKYNTSVTVNNDEGVIDYGQGGKLYKKYKNIISNFIKSELIGLHSLGD